MNLGLKKIIANTLFFIKIFQNVSCEYVPGTTDGWLKLKFASCVVRKTRSLGALVLCSICNVVFVNYIYDMVADTVLSCTSFMVGRSRMFHMYSS